MCRGQGHHYIGTHHIHDVPLSEEKEFSLLVSLRRIEGATLIAIAWVTFLLPDESLPAEPGTVLLSGSGPCAHAWRWGHGLGNRQKSIV